MADPLIAKFRHPLTLAGAAVTTITALLFLAFFALDLFGTISNPYLGIVFFIILPAFFAAGLALIPAGIWLARRRRQLGLPARMQTWPRLDLNNPATRRVWFTIALLTPVNILIIGLASYKGLEAMDSVEFCGQACHTVMEPELVAHQSGPHARVKCVECHIGPGAGWFVKSKLSGARQVYAVLFNTHGRPIPTPVHDLRPARETCEQCHWPTQFHGDKVETFREYGEDETNSESVTTVRLKIGGLDAGGTARGIHWHVAEDNVVEYVATGPDRQTIPYVRLVRGDGTVTEFFAEGTTAAPAGEARRMDCVDCHNRPSHTFSRSADRAVNQAMALGALSRTLPFVRREAGRVLKVEYATQEEGLRQIGSSLSGFYEREYPDLWTTRRGDINRAVQNTQELYRRNVFPSMKVTWGLHADNRGHMEFPGCFRCHDDSHKTKDGRAISQDCSLCHDVE